MLRELLESPSRRFTNVPELVRFFKENCGDDWERLLERYLQAFTGTTIQIPGPKYLADLRTDMEIVRRLQAADSIDARVDILLEHSPRVTHQYMQEIYASVTGKHLPMPDHEGGRGAALKVAAIHLKRNTKLHDDIIQMFQFTAGERAELSSMLGRKQKPPTQPSKPKKKVKRGKA